MSTLNEYTPFIYLWVLRLLCSVLCYFYDSRTEGLIFISWVLLSFLLPKVFFVKMTIYILLPFLNIQFLYYYLINIPGLFYAPGTNTTDSIIFSNYRGIIFTYPVFETLLFYITLVFIVLLIPSAYILKL